MELVILGSGTCVPTLERGPSGYALMIGGHLILMDGGSGSLRRLLEARLSYRDIDYILYSHPHIDHTAELLPLLFALKNTPGFLREKKLTILAPKGFGAIYNGLLSIYGDWVISPSYEIELIELWDDEFKANGWKAKSKPMHHRMAIGYRIEMSDGKTLVYSGDTGICSEIIELARGADLLIIECSFPDGIGVEGHLTPSEAGKIARASAAKKLVLTHLYPICDDYDVVTQCRAVYDGEVVLARDLLRLYL